MSERILKYNEEWKLMICKRCCVGVFRKRLVGHLSGKAHRMKKREVEEVIREVSEKYELVSAKDWEVVREVEGEVEDLNAKIDGFRCVVRDEDGKECGFCFGKLSTMEKHWTNDHRGLKGQKGNRAKELLNELNEKKLEWYMKVKIQRFGETSDLKTWFWVKEDDESEREVVSESVRERIMREFTEERKRMDILKTKYITEGETGREMIPWLKTMGWERYLTRIGIERRMLLVLGADVKENKKEKLIWESIGRLLRMSEDLVDEMGEKVLRDLVRSEKDARADGKKMERYKHKNEIEDKGRWLKRIVMVLVRNGGEVGALEVIFSEEERTTFNEMMRYVEYMVDEEDGEDSEIIRGERQRWRRGKERQLKIRRGELRDNGRRETVVKVFGLDLRVLRFVMAMVRRTSNTNEYRLSMVCGLAVCGVKESGWMTAARFGPVLSGLLKCLRLMLLVECFQGDEVVEDGEEWIENEEGFPLAQMVEERVDRWMIRGTKGVVWWLLEKRAYTMNVGMTETVEGALSWRDDGERVIDGDIEFTMNGLRGMIWGLIEEGRRSVRRVVFGKGKDREEDMPMIRWDELRDDATRTEIGFSFVSYERNRWTVDGEIWLMRKMVDEKRMIDVNGEWNFKEIGRWLDEVVRLKEWLLILTHLCCGQPSRGPEILGMRWCSSGEGEGRNIFMEDGDLVSVLRDHKGSWRGELKVILRYFPRELGELMVWYLWLIVRCAEIWEKRWRGEYERVRDIERERELESEEDEEEEETEKRRETRLERERAEREKNEWKGSTLIWGEDHNGAKWEENRLRRLLVRSFEDGLNVRRLGVAKWRHIVIGISRQHLRTTLEDEEENIMDEQAGHSSGMAERIYGRMLSERGGESEGKRAQFRRISEEWFRFLRLTVSEKSAKRKRVTMNDELMVKHEERVRKDVMLRLNLDELLREKTGMVFRGRQKEILELIQRGEERVLGIMKTGGGKSMVFMFWGLTPGNGMTVVVVPLVVLKDDLISRCESMGIDVAGWDWKNQPIGRRMVVVVMETSIGEEFERFLRKVKENGRLDRIVIDEVHMVMNESETFRPKLRDLGRLNRWEVPIVMLSGTIPVSIETKLIERMNMRREDVAVVRGSTERSELVWRMYDMKTTGYHEKREELEELVIRKKRKIARWGGGCILIYCASVREVKYWGERLNGQVYWSGSENKLEVVRWLKGDGVGGRDEEETVKVVIGSSAFGMGVDVKAIRVVMFMYEVEGMLDFIQGGGRAGRGGLKSEVVLVRGNTKMAQRGQRVKDEGWLEMVEWTKSKECRRKVMSRYLDGDEERLECREGEEKCDMCGSDEDLEDILEVEVEEVDEVEERGEVVDDDVEDDVEEDLYVFEGHEDVNEVELERVREVEARERDRLERKRRNEVESERRENERREHGKVKEEQRLEEEKRARELERSERKLVLIAKGRDETERREREMVRKMERWLREWKDSCMFCHEEMDGSEVDVDDVTYKEHRLIDCSRWTKNDELRRRMYEDRRLRWESMGGCFDCGIWFGVCNKWTERESGGVGSGTAGGGLYEQNKNVMCDLKGTVAWLLQWIGMHDSKWETEQRERLERVGRSQDGWEGESKMKVKFGGKNCYEGLVMIMKYLESKESREGRGRDWFEYYYELEEVDQ